ncbi:hypothetical protein CWS72_12240 [Telmatospirillum siberiense]|uniref:Uncharacterized protein n=2 Tax=Telmatospirillum siberiense TaxID=382514 RepID=A0A2N3PVB7_9PROT|nr:hypothetical protein CWS72_12240 [Telmatospirillum siberiense]
MVHFGGEGIPYANSSLDLENNTFVNNYGGTAIALTNSTIDVATVSGNTFDNFASSANLVKGGAELTGNVDGDGTAISNTTQDALTPGDGVWIFADDQPHSLVFTDYGQAAQGGDGLLTISSDWGHETVIGGQGGLIYTDTGPASAEAGDNITTAIGSINQIAVLGGDTINSRGTDTITLGNGNCTIGVSGTANISGGTGNSTFQVRAGATLALDMTGGSNWITIASGASATVSGNAVLLSGTWSGGQFAYSITQDGTTSDATFIGGGGTAGVYQGHTNITLAGGSIGSNVSLGAGNVTLTSVGADIIHAGSGNDTIIVSGNSTIYAGSGQLSVFGRGESGVATVYGNGGTTLIDGDSGGIDYIGDSQAASIVDNLSYTEIDGRNGHLTITGTGWVRTINGGSGGIDVINALGGDTITTAAGSTNTISMIYGADVYSNGNDTITCGSWGTNIIATGNATITGGQGNSHYTLNGIDSLTSYASDTINVGDSAIATVIASGTVSNINDNGGTIHFSGVSQGDDIDATLTGVGTIYTWGGSNASTITTSTTGAVVTLAKGNDHVISLGADDITTGSGNDYIQASAQGDRIHIIAGSDAHSITIANLSTTADTIDFSGFASTPIVSQTLDSSGLVVHLSDGSTMTANGFASTLSTPVDSQTATIARQNCTATLQGDNDTVSVTGSADTLAFYGNNATVAISGNFAQTTINGDSASVTVSGSWDTTAVSGSDNNIRVTGQKDTVSIGASGTTTIDAGGASDAIIQFGSGISADQLWFSRNGDDLLVSVIGTNEQTDLQNWYAGTSSDISQFKTADGHALLNTQVSNLVDAMASLSAPAPGQTTLSTTQATQLEPVIAANWH